MRFHWLAGLTGILTLTTTAAAQPGAAAPDGVGPAPSPSPAAAPPPTGPAASGVDPTLAPPGAAPIARDPAANPSYPGYPTQGAGSYPPPPIYGAYPSPRGYGAYPPPPGEHDTYESYRWQLLALDAAGFALDLAGGKTGNDTALEAGTLIYLLGGPTLHLANHESGRALGSLGVRLAVPLVGGLVGAIASSHGNHCGNPDTGYDSCDDDGPVVGAIVGLGVGLFAAALIDDLAIARPHKVRHDTGFAWSPAITKSRDRAGLGVVGRF